MSERTEASAGQQSAGRSASSLLNPAFFGVVATSASNAWAVGSTTSSLALIEHWNGSTWTATTVH